MILADDFDDLRRNILFARDLDSFFFDLIEFADIAHERMRSIIWLEAADSFDSETAECVMLADLTATSGTDSIAQFRTVFWRNTHYDLYEFVHG